MYFFKLKNYLSMAWLLLISLTFFAFLLGWLKLINHSYVMLLLITTFIKGQIVVDYFMQLKQVQLKWRIIPLLWLFIVISLITLAYYTPKI